MSSAETKQPSSALLVEVYSGPSCMKCKVTKGAFDKAGVEYVSLEAADHPEIIEEVVAAGLARALPVVRVTDAEGTVVDLWSDLRDGKIKELASGYLK